MLDRVRLERRRLGRTARRRHRRRTPRSRACRAARPSRPGSPPPPAAASARSHQHRRDVEVAAQQLEREPAAGREEPGPRRLLAEQLDGAHAPVHPGQVEHLPGHGQPPQLGLQPRVGVAQVCGGVVEPDRPVPAPGQVVGSPVRGERRIEGVGQQQRVVQPLGQVERLERERPRPDAARSRRPSSGPARRPAGRAAPARRGVVRRVQPDRQQPGGQVVLLAAGQARAPPRRGRRGRRRPRRGRRPGRRRPWRPRRRRRPRPPRPGPAATPRTSVRSPST